MLLVSLSYSMNLVFTTMKTQSEETVILMETKEVQTEFQNINAYHQNMQFLNFKGITFKVIKKSFEVLSLPLKTQSHNQPETPPPNC